MEKRYDLHCHSLCSDGTNTPKELIDLAKKEVLAGISITDHDSIDAYTDELFQYAGQNEIELIYGAEFSTVFMDTGIHVLAYCYNPQNAGLLELCKRHKERRENRNREMIALLNAGGYEITYDEVKGQSKNIVGRPHIAKVLIDKGYATDIEDAFTRLIGDSKPFFVPGDRFQIEETIEIIQKAGGKAVIAHPHLIKRNKVLKALLKLPFDGIEAYYGTFSAAQKDKMAEIGKEKGWILTGGSDFHGTVKAFLTLGRSYTNEENKNRLFAVG